MCRNDYSLTIFTARLIKIYSLQPLWSQALYKTFALTYVPKDVQLVKR